MHQLAGNGVPSALRDIIGVQTQIAGFAAYAEPAYQSDPDKGKVRRHVLLLA